MFFQKETLHACEHTCNFKFAKRNARRAATLSKCSRSDGMSAFEPLSSGLPLPGPRGARGRKRPLEINRDQYRAVNPRYTCDEMSSVDIAALNVELRCPICLRLMRDPVATECLHRFCKDCIEKCQRQAQKQCPSCRKPIATRRSLRPDPSMKRLIAKLYPDLDAFEADEEAEMLASNRNMAEAHLANIEKVLERQRALVAASREQEPPAVEYEATSSSRTARGASGRGAGAGGSRGRNDAMRAADETRHQRSVDQAVVEQLQRAAVEESDAYDDDDEDDDEEEDYEDEDEESDEGEDDDESNSGDGDQIGTQDYENWAFEGRGSRSKGAATGGIATGGASSARTGGRPGANVVHRKSSLPSPGSQSEAQRAAVEAAQSRLQLIPRPTEVGFRLQPHPEHRGRVERLVRDFVCVSRDATIDHVHKFLCHNLSPQHAQLPSAEQLGAQIGAKLPRQFDVHVAVPSLEPPSANGQRLLTKLRPEMTLFEVLTTFHIEKHNFDLYYVPCEPFESSSRAPDDGAPLSPATRLDERSE